MNIEFKHLIIHISIYILYCFVWICGNVYFMEKQSSILSFRTEKYLKEELERDLEMNLKYYIIFKYIILSLGFFIAVKKWK